MHRKILFYKSVIYFTLVSFVLFYFLTTYQDTQNVPRFKRRSNEDNSNNDNIGLSPFSLKEIVEKEFSIRRWNGSWATDREIIYRQREGGGLYLYDVKSGARGQLLLSGSVLNGAGNFRRVYKYTLSPDKRFLLLSYAPQKIFRHSFLATYEVYEIEGGKSVKLAPNSQSEGLQPLTYATWSNKGSALAYVFANNIYYRPNPFAKDVQITTSGEPGVIFNGVADWVYEEEVLSASRALWFSPRDDYVAWIQFNDTGVDTMPINLYGEPGSLNFQYPFSSPIKYPKPGRPNPSVNAYVSYLPSDSKPNIILLEPPNYFLNQERLIYALTWASDVEISLTWENRVQNHSIVSICNVPTATCNDALVMSEGSGWLELDAAPVFKGESGREFALVLNSDGYNHVNVINRDTNQRIPITTGKMTVTEISHWDEDQHKIYFIATRPGYPGERHLYSVTDFDATVPGSVECLTCNLSNSQGGRCGFNSFQFSKDFSYYVVSCLGPYVPQDYLYRKEPNQLIEIIQRNDYLTSQLSRKKLPKVSNLDIPIKNGAFSAKVRLYLPPNFDETKKYPLLINVYAGPNSQQVSDRFKLDWGTYLTTSHGVIYGLIDARGSGFQGNELLFELYRKLGGPEVEDQLDVTQKLVQQYSFIDKNNIAIWGWSYGGFVSSSVLALDAEQGTNLFKCGIAVAPVTNWIYYDTIYSERYMGLPTPFDNLRAYQASDISLKASRFKNKKLFIVHGTADDNVHYQQSMMLARALEQENVLFQQMAYPDEAHALAGIRPHFFHSLTNFLLKDCFERNVTGNLYV